MQDNALGRGTVAAGTTEKDPGDAPSPGWIAVWDMPVRVFHWTLAVSVLTAWFSAGKSSLVHETAGYIVLALVVFRLYWGFAGTRYARFKDFVPSPFAVLRYMRQMRTFDAPRFVGHNPAGGAMMVLILLLLAVITATGWLLITRAFFGVSWMEQIHDWTATILIWLIPIHVLGALFSSALHKENLVGAMFTGRKPVHHADEIVQVVRSKEEQLLDRLRASEALAVVALFVAAGVTVGVLTRDTLREREQDAKARAPDQASAQTPPQVRAQALALPIESTAVLSIETTPAQSPAKPLAATIRDLQDYISGGPENPSRAWMISSGGRLYDRWYAATRRPPPSTTHPSWPTDNTNVKGADTWRCKSCHGWDYLGRDGQYRSGPNATGIRGIARARNANVESIIAVLENNTHQYTDALLPGHAKLRLAMFISEGQHDVGKLFHPNGKPKGDPVRGGALFQNVCAACHGFDGKGRRLGASANPAYTGDPLYVGTKANDNPIEVLHKIRNGHPGAMMISLRALAIETALDVLSYAQTLPTR